MLPAPPEVPDHARASALIAGQRQEQAELAALVDRSMAVPDTDVHVRLEAPDGSTWEWGSGPDEVSGPALDFCLLVTQRRHRDDLALHATAGPADEWLTLAQAIAGPPGPGRTARSHRA